MIRCLVVDDEPLALDILEDYISKIPFLTLVKSTTSAIEGLSLVQSDAIDLVFLDVQMPELTGIQFYDHEVVGFEVVDDNFGPVGILETIVDLPVNPLIQIKNPNGKEVLIPFVKNLVQEVDRKNRILRVNAPDGLIAIYLG